MRVRDPDRVAVFSRLQRMPFLRALVQRVKEARVAVDDRTVGEIGFGLLVFLGVRNGDTQREAAFLADKCAHLRVFCDESGKFNLSSLDMGAEILIVSQFTLYGDTRKGRRPSFVDAAPPDVSEPLYDRFVECVRGQGLRTETGVFGAMMEVILVNDGPVTLLLEKDGDGR